MPAIRNIGFIVLKNEEMKEYNRLSGKILEIENEILILDDFSLSEGIVKCLEQWKFLLENRKNTFSVEKLEKETKRYDKLADLINNNRIVDSRIPDDEKDYDDTKKTLTNELKLKLDSIKSFCENGFKSCMREVQETNEAVRKYLRIDSVALNDIVFTQMTVLEDLLRLLELIYEYESSKESKS